MRTCAMTHSCIWSDSFLGVSHDTTYSYIRHDDSVTCGPWLLPTCAMPHTHVCNDSFVYVKWLTSRRIARYDIFICLTRWLIHTSYDAMSAYMSSWFICLTAYLYVWHDDWLHREVYEWETHVWMRNVCIWMRNSCMDAFNTMTHCILRCMNEEVMYE